MKYLPLLGLIFLLSNCAREESRMFAFIPPDADLVWFGEERLQMNDPIFPFMGLESSQLPPLGDWWKAFDLPPSSPLTLVRIPYQVPVWFGVLAIDQPPLPALEREPSIYQRVEVYQLESPTGLFYAILDGFLLVSDQAIGVEKAIYQYKNGARWFATPKGMEEDSPWIWSPRIPGMQRSAGTFWQQSGISEGESWSFLGRPVERMPMTPKAPVLEIFEHALFASDSIFPLPASEHWGAGWETANAFGPYLLFPAANFSMEGFDVLKEKDHLQFTVQQLLLPATPQLGDDPWLLKLEDYWILHQDLSGLQLLIDAMLQNGVLSSDPDLLHLMDLLGDEAHFVSFEQQASFQRLIGWKAEGWVGSLGVDVQKTPLEITHRFLCEGGEVLTLLHLQTSGQDRFLIQDAAGQLAFTNEKLEVIWQVQELDTIMGAWIIPGLSSRAPDQILYQTRSFAHLMSLEGLPVMEEAVVFPAPSKYSGTVIRFEEMSASYLFLPSTDSRIYAFDLSGVPLPGWEDGIKTEPLLFPLQHFVWEDGDYIFSIDTSGSLLVFNRFGEWRFPPVKGECGTQPAYFLDETVQRIVWAESNGKLRVVNLQGATFRLDVGAVPPIHQFSFWKDQDSSLVYGVLDADELIQAGYEGSNYSVGQRSATPIGATQVFLSSHDNTILGYWQGAWNKFYVPSIQQAIPFSFRPLVLPNNQGDLLVGANENEVRVYQVGK